jgi:hypothetical protein
MIQNTDSSTAENATDILLVTQIQSLMEIRVQI